MGGEGGREGGGGVGGGEEILSPDSRLSLCVRRMRARRFSVVRGICCVVSVDGI